MWLAVPAASTTTRPSNPWRASLAGAGARTRSRSAAAMRCHPARLVSLPVWVMSSTRTITRWTRSATTSVRCITRSFTSPTPTTKRRIFAIAGNHDGKHTHEQAHIRDRSIFSATSAPNAAGAHLDNQTDRRVRDAAALSLLAALDAKGVYPRPVQQHREWRHPRRSLASQRISRNIAGWWTQLADDEAPQRAPQTAQSRSCWRCTTRPSPAQATSPSGASRRWGHRNATRRARPLATVLRQAFDESGQRPDAVFSAHAHLFQRLTYRHADGWEIPYVIAGSGGHGPVESLWERCDKTKRATQESRPSPRWRQSG